MWLIIVWNKQVLMCQEESILGGILLILIITLGNKNLNCHDKNLNSKKHTLHRNKFVYF